MSNHDPHSHLAAEIAAAVQSRLSANDPQVANVIQEEVSLALGARPFDQALAEAAEERAQSTEERVVVTATGHNRSGVVARLATAIDEFNGDIREISQTIVGEYFTVIFVVDIAGATSQGARFATFRERLQSAARDLGIHVVAIHDDILSTMHAV